MRTRRWTFVLALAVAAAAVVILRHGRGPLVGRHAPGGIVIGDTGLYELFSRLVLGSLFEGVAADVASAVPPRARVLEAGCGPGHLSLRLADDHGFDVTGFDLDPAMIARARANAERSGVRTPTFLVADVASLGFPDGTFDAVVSTLSMHHWADPAAGLREIERVLRPGGRALVWDLRRGIGPLHAHLPDPVETAEGSPMRVVGADTWPWPWKLRLLARLELASPDG